MYKGRIDIEKTYTRRPVSLILRRVRAITQGNVIMLHVHLWLPVGDVSLKEHHLAALQDLCMLCIIVP